MIKQVSFDINISFSNKYKNNHQAKKARRSELFIMISYC